MRDAIVTELRVTSAVIVDAVRKKETLRLSRPAERIFTKGLNSSAQTSSTESIMDLDDYHLEPFSGYTFPAVHELQSYACANTEDCGGKENVECADVMDRSNQKVCKCTKDAYLDVQSKTCGKENHATSFIQLGKWDLPFFSSSL